MYKDQKIKLLQKIENLVFQGGGVKGIAYLGALDFLFDEQNDKLPTIKRVGGASSGAVIALSISLGHSVSQIKSDKELIDLIQLLDDDIRVEDFSAIDLLRITHDLFFEIKNQGDYFKQMYVDLPREKPTVTKLIQYLVLRLLEIFAENYDYKSGSKDTFYNSVKSYFIKIAAVSAIHSEAQDSDTAVERDFLQKFICHQNKNISENNFMNNLYELLYLGWEKQGIYSGKKFLKKFENMLPEMSQGKRCTFRDLKNKNIPNSKELSIVVMDLNCKIPHTVVFSHDTTPDAYVADAIRASMSIPFFFQPAKISGRNLQGEEYVIGHTYFDGGTLDNYPIWLFDKGKYINSDKNIIWNEKTLGFKLASTEQILFYENKTDYKQSQTQKMEILIETCFSSFFNKEDIDFYHSGNLERTILINDQNISTIQFHLQENAKNKLIESGKMGTISFLERFLQTSNEKQTLYNPEKPKGIAINVIDKKMDGTLNIFSLLDSRSYPIKTQTYLLKMFQEFKIKGIPWNSGQTGFLFTAIWNNQKYSLKWIISNGEFDIVNGKASSTMEILMNSKENSLITNIIQIIISISKEEDYFLSTLISS
jgi:NTE family protein